LNAVNLKPCRALIAALVFAAMPVAYAQSQTIPQPWISYAQLTGHQLQASLEEDSDAANELHRFIEDRILNAKGDAPPAAIVIRAWIGADGTVTRVEFNSLGDPKADALMRTLLTAHPISEPPPSDMRQPLRVRLRLEVNPDAAPDGSDAPASGGS
jgi:hypothetical protein